ncbi:MAG: DUF86 domain-containing protein [Bacillota bacterium]|nr:DUF86 domain-containing protein [Bacillota bacterium]
MINVSLVQERLSLIKSYLTELEELRRFEREAFLADKKVIGATESYLRRSLEAVFDVGRHILAKTGGADLTLEYKSIAQGLAARGVVDRHLGEQLVKMAGYRNRLVHLYHLVTDEELYEIIQSDLDDIRGFVVAIRDFLGRQGRTNSAQRH